MTEFINTSANLTNPVCAPQGLGDIFGCANHYTGNFITLGFLGVVWFVIFNSGLQRGYRVIPSLIGANFVVMLASFILYVGEILPGWAPFVAMVAVAGSLTLSYVYE